MQTPITPERRQELLKQANGNLLEKLKGGDLMASIFILVALDDNRYGVQLEDLAGFSKSVEVVSLLNEQGSTIRAARDQIQQLKARIAELEQQVKGDEATA